MLVGYARVSTLDQNASLQTDALEFAGCKRIFVEKASGSRAQYRGEKATVIFEWIADHWNGSLGNGSSVEQPNALDRLGRT
jgi:hypothetical protein